MEVSTGPTCAATTADSATDSITHAEMSSDDWWNAATEPLKQWVAANPLGIGFSDDGSFQIVKLLLQRGDQIAEARVKCCLHIALELHGVPGAHQHVENLLQNADLRTLVPNVAFRRMLAHTCFLGTTKSDLALSTNETEDKQMTDNDGEDVEKMLQTCYSADVSQFCGSPKRGKLRPRQISSVEKGRQMGGNNGSEESDNATHTHAAVGEEGDLEEEEREGERREERGVERGGERRRNHKKQTAQQQQQQQSHLHEDEEEDKQEEGQGASALAPSRRSSAATTTDYVAAAFAALAKADEIISNKVKDRSDSDKSERSGGGTGKALGRLKAGKRRSSSRLRPSNHEDDDGGGGGREGGGSRRAGRGGEREREMEKEKEDRHGGGGGGGEEEEEKEEKREEEEKEEGGGGEGSHKREEEGAAEEQCHDDFALRSSSRSRPRTMMERQQEWLEKKRKKEEEQRAKKKEEEMEGVTFRPKINQYRPPAHVSMYKSSHSATTNEAEAKDHSQEGDRREDGHRKQKEKAKMKVLDVFNTAKTRPSSSSSSSSLSQSTTTMPHTKSEDPVEKNAIKDKKKKASKKMSKYKKQVVKCDLLDFVKSDLGVDLATSAMSTLGTGARSSSCDEELKTVSVHSAATSASARAGNNVSSSSSSSPSSPSSSSSSSTTTTTTTICSPPTPSSTFSSAPVVETSTVNARGSSSTFQFDSNSTADKGRFRIRDASLFSIESMYRKKDNASTMDGVSLLVGRREETMAEEVITILFDRSKFTEQLAGEWWEKNSHRFLSK